MSEKTGWNWETGVRQIANITKQDQEVEWREESQVSPNGEQIAAVVKTGDMEFGLCVNETVLEEVYDRAWYPRYSPDGRLTCLVTVAGEPTLSIDGQAMEERFGFIWRTTFAGDSIAAAIQNDMRYGMLHNGQIWKNLFINANSFVLSASGKTTAACIQAEEMAQADIKKFQEGIFSVAVNGQAWKSKFVNTWTPAVSSDDQQVAVQIRKDLYTYSIAVNDQAWHQNFAMVWEPCFHPLSHEVFAPVRIGGKWGMAQDGHLVWPAVYGQLWQQQFNADGSVLAAITSPAYGKWTVCVNNTPWKSTVDRMLADLTVSEDGKTLAVLGKNTQDMWAVIVNDCPWSGSYEMTSPPIISSDGAYVGISAEKNGRQTIVVNDREYAKDFVQVWEPVFNPTNDKVLIRALDDQGNYLRIVEALSTFTQ